MGRFEVADPSHKAHSGWPKLLKYWRDVKHRQNRKKKREADSEYNEAFLEKRRQQRRERIEREPDFIHRENEKAYKRLERLKREDPEEWERRVAKKRVINRRWYSENKEEHIERTKARMAEIRENDPEEWERRQNKIKRQKYDSFYRNRKELARRKRVRRKMKKGDT